MELYPPTYKYRSCTIVVALIVQDPNLEGGHDDLAALPKDTDRF
jgi:hypothetical protein